MGPSILEISSTIIFAIAIIHTFLVSKLAKMANKYPEGSIGENIFHYLAEIEAVFGIWSLLFFIVMMFNVGHSKAIQLMKSTLK